MRLWSQRLGLSDYYEKYGEIMKLKRMISQVLVVIMVMTVIGLGFTGVEPASANSRCNRNNHSHPHWGNAHRDYDDFKSVRSYKQGGIWYNSYQHYRRTHNQWQSPAVCG